MKVNDALNILELQNKYSINNLNHLKINDLKKQYHILALNYHPDKNNNHNSKEHFQHINNSYLFLKNIIKYDENKDENKDENIDENIDENKDENKDENIDENNQYYELIINFINIIKKDINNNISITDFQNDCKKYIYEIIENFINKLNLNVLQEIYKILIMIDNSNNNININIDEKIKNIIIENIKEKFKSYNIFILNPKLNNIFNSEVYIMDLDNKTIYIPLWHNELNYNNNIFKIEPIIDKNISIDENNNLHYNYYSKYEDFVNLIRINKDDFPHIEIIIEKYNLVIPLNELNFKKYQTYVFKNIGLPKINTKDVFEHDKKGNIIIHIYLE